MRCCTGWRRGSRLTVGKVLIRWRHNSAYQFEGIVRPRHQGDEDFLPVAQARALAVCKVVEIVNKNRRK